MSSRKQTPDVLGEILGGPPDPEEAPKAQQKRRTASPKRARMGTTRAKSGAKPDQPPQWEYMEVIFRDMRGWRPRVINGREQRSWQDAPLMYEYLEQVGAEGWELVNINQQRFQKEAYFKRPKAAP